MGVMAVTAYQFVFTDRVGRGLIGLGPNGLMAGITDFRLGRAFLYLAGFMDGMATDAGHVVGFMSAGMPVQQVGITLVTFQADAILCFQRRWSFAAKAD